MICFIEDGRLATRLKFCNKETSKNVLIAQLEVTRGVDLPLFLYNHETGDDLLNIMKGYYFIEGRIEWWCCAFF